MNKPIHGWDRPADVEEVKRRLSEWKGIVVNDSELDLMHLEAMIHLGYSHGLQQETMHGLLLEYGLDNPSPIHPTKLRNIIREFYVSHQNEIPGRQSKAGADTIDLSKSEEASEEYIWDPRGDPWPTRVDYDEKQNPAKLAERFIAARPFDIIFAEGQFFECRNRIWRKLSRHAIAHEIRQTNPTHSIDERRIVRMIRSIEIDRFVDTKPYEWIVEPIDAPEPKDLILFGNGMLDFASGRLLPHTANFFATGTPSFGYDPEADCPVWRQKLDEWLAPSLQVTLQEFIGYLMTPDTSLDAILTLVGPPRSGKGTIFFVIEQLVGPDHFASRMMADLGGEFGLQGCEDNELFLIPDAANITSQNCGKAIERMKAISGRDAISINRKNLAMLNDRRINAKIVLAANQHPKFKDDSTALATRQVIIPFTRSFRGKEDRTLRDRLANELPGIANWALEGLRRLRDQGWFTIGAEGRAAAAELAESHSIPLRFARAELRVTGNDADFVAPGDMWERFTLWRLEENLHVSEHYDQASFRSALLAAIGHMGVRYDRVRRRGARGRFFLGVKLRPAKPSHDFA